jgi:uncharacterized protein YuzE
VKATAVYDPEADAVYVRFSDGAVDHTIDVGRVSPELPMLVDVDDEGRILGIEIVTARSVLRVTE